MNKRLLWKLCITIAAGTVVMYWAINNLTRTTESQMSFIDQHYQQILLGYGAEAERLYRAGDMVQLGDWLTGLQARENTWAAVVSADIKPLAGSQLAPEFTERFRLGRDVRWKIHLYFKDNPVMDFPFADNKTFFVITLPQRMRPGEYWHYAQVLLQIALPLLVLIIVSFVLYRHVMQPLRQLESAARQFSEGKFDVRVRNALGARNDELTLLAETFDRMAERTGALIITQRQLIADLSHELRTPLARVDIALQCAERNLVAPKETFQRIARDSKVMRELVEDTLTLAWLENEKPLLAKENLDLVDLLDSIIDNARFEFPQQHIASDLPPEAALVSCQRSLGQAIENIVRNALKHTQIHGEVRITLQARGHDWCLLIEDQGPGVPEEHLQNIFKPFFRMGLIGERERSGFGIGLALAQRQIEAASGQIEARNLPHGGLQMIILLPMPAWTSANL
jgi:two-component system sensor histidine kinase PfeS